MHLTHKIAVNFGDHVTPEEAQKIMDNFCKDLLMTGAIQSIKPVSNKFDKIRQWAFDKGILTNGDAKTQSLKLMEEAGEIAKAVLRNNTEEGIDGIGDCVVVLTSLAHFHGVHIEACIDAAYNVIESRTGTMRDGNFVKSEDDAKQ